MTSNSNIDSNVEVPDAITDDMSPKAVARWVKNQDIIDSPSAGLSLLDIAVHLICCVHQANSINILFI